MGETTNATKAAPEEPTPKRTRGRPKGLGKVPGSGRKKKVVSWTAPEVRERLLPVTAEKIQKIINGERIQVSGPTGKAKWVYPTVDQVLKAAEIALRKTMPDLSATSIKADVTTETITDDTPPDPRVVARTIVNILGKAQLPEEPPEPPPPQQNGQLLIGRDPIIEVDATPVRDDASHTGASHQGGEGSTAVPSPPVDAVALPEGAHVLKNGKIEFKNGATIQHDVERDKWCIVDVTSVPHGWRRDKAEAIAFANKLPMPSLMGHVGSDSPPPPEDYAKPSCRRDQVVQQHREPRVVRRRPREF